MNGMTMFGIIWIACGIIWIALGFLWIWMGANR